jgi:hypothetical protein
MAATKAVTVPSVVAIKNGGLFSSANGVFDDEQQCRQRHVEQEEVHPGEASFRQALRLAAGEANENQAEIRHGEIENIDHS